MPTFIKPGFWEKRQKGYDHWLNLDELITELIPPGVASPFKYDTCTSIIPNLGSNCASASYSIVGGGIGNTASNSYSTIGGGRYNNASGYISTIGGGNNNIASGYSSTIGGGQQNIASGNRSGILGGANNNTNGYTRAMIVGSYITANRADTTFVGQLSIMSIPTSPAGLPSGSIYRIGNAVCIVI